MFPNWLLFPLLSDTTFVSDDASVLTGFTSWVGWATCSVCWSPVFVSAWTAPVVVNTPAEKAIVATAAVTHCLPF